ncbi:hypothetical protein WJX74_005186 [Apatococcus lobatus]|uniref:carotenoid 9,10-dioxygenase n=1 Tax=Apatococcus lobatus TaxID=904363 RepID=A0AAW1RP93_9CHLO
MLQSKTNCCWSPYPLRARYRIASTVSSCATGQIQCSDPRVDTTGSTGMIGEVKGFAGFLHVLLFAAKIRLGFVDPGKGIGTANTSLVFHAQRLLALQESDMPYAVRVMCSGLLRTLSRQTFDEKLQHPFTAHPNVDLATGNVTKDFPIHTIKEPIMMHDFAVARSHVIFFECPMIFDTVNMVEKNEGPFRWDAKRPTRFWVLQRNATSSQDICCFMYPQAMFVMHTAAAFEEADVIYLYASAQPRFQLVSPQKGRLGGPLSHSLWHPHLYEFTFNLTSGEMTRTALAPGLSSDMPAIDRSLSGQLRRRQLVLQVPGMLARRLLLEAGIGSRVRYIYTATMSTGPLVCFDRLVKYDLEAPAGQKVVGLIDHGGPRYVGGEAFFVPRADDGPFRKCGEDDGYLLTYVHDTKLDVSWFVVYNACTFDCEPVARVRLPQRVPYGFHCLHVPEKDLKTQDFSLA